MAGRHRKPTHTKRNVASVAASGAFLLPAAGVADARVPEPVVDASSSGAWDVIARCESGNRNINNTGYPEFTASGYFQITNGTWRLNGGTEFASRAIGASRAQQLTVAQRIAERRGSLADWNASKGCWGDEISSAVPRAASPSVPPKVTQSAPRTKAQRVSGGRAADGSGTYVCTTDKLSFDACDPDTLGQVVAYPLYSGRVASVPAPSGPVRGATVAALATTAAASTSSIVSAARGWIGAPYRYGGTTRSGLDCSALVQNVLRAQGINAPRTSAAQYAWTRRISAAQARPGDLVFFYSPVSHVGIYLGNGLMIDAPRPGATVGVRSVYPGAKYGRIPA